MSVNGINAGGIKPAFGTPPETWGLRGDSHLWNEMGGLCDLHAGASLGEMQAHLRGLFAGLTGSSIEADDPVKVDRYPLDGMSGGFVSPAFWREKAIPLLVRRMCTRKAVSVFCWNVNNRVGMTKFRPEAVHAAMATGADVLAFTEFFPQDGLNAFRAALRDGGWVHQAMSFEAKTRANRILVASRLPLEVRELPPSPVDDHLATNSLRVGVDGALEILCIRVPTYEGEQRAAAWDWIGRVAAGMRCKAPALIIGDLNTSERARVRVPQFSALTNSWRRLQPAGTGSYFGRNGVTSEIDHAFINGHVDGAAWYVRRAEDFQLAGGEEAISDHAGICVQLALSSV